MIYHLAFRKQKLIAWFFFILFYLSTFVPVWAFKPVSIINHNCIGYISNPNISRTSKIPLKVVLGEHKGLPMVQKPVVMSNESAEDGGPSQPEMSSFQSVNANNLVNSFTGNFSYNIPLLDVGGYPVNIFYDGSITPEQEASWVGLGWNINPGAITRNMRGVPDDFDGTDIMTQTQGMKPNKTWGVNLGANVEFVGLSNISLGVGEHLGVSFNNYLGPAIEYGANTHVGFNLAKKASTEKSPFSPSIGGGFTLSSREGATASFSANCGYSKQLKKAGESLTMGIGLSTSYNSRSGIKALQITDQLSFSKQNLYAMVKAKGDIAKRDNTSYSGNLFSTSISFSKPSYLPAIRMPITHKSGTGRFQLGWGIQGAFASASLEVYAQYSEIKDEDKVQRKPMYGYFNYEKGNGDKDAMLDFTRLGDKEVSPQTPVISAPEYTYDVFSISGEGTGGSIRAYRGDLGTMRDNYVKTKDASWGAGVDIGLPGHYGANFNTVYTPSVITEWRDGNYLRNAIPFTEASGLYENIYFRNPGESSVIPNGKYSNIGGTDLVRFKLGGNPKSPEILPVLQVVNKDDKSTLGSTLNISQTQGERVKRAQVINFFAAKDAALIGLDKAIKSYNRITPLTTSGADIGSLQYTTINRVSSASEAETFRKPHHISQINVTETDGKRYIYGLPVYNISQADYTFTTSRSATLDANNFVTYNPNDYTPASSYLDAGSTEDGYLQITETPAYAHSFLLSGLLSPDYVDITGNGITEDDAGNAVKFNYTKMEDNFKWRAPYTTDPNKANFNIGNRTEGKDNKGLISYGVRESWYMHSIESKTMVAIFTLKNREDGKGVNGRDGVINVNDHSLQRLEKIDLYSKSDLKTYGLSAAKPIKTVHFEYDYSLCGGTPDNSAKAVDKDYNLLSGGDVTDATKNINIKKGKLTLRRVYFTFNSQAKINKNQYVFGYKNNPDYGYNNSDRWGNYKPKSLNPGTTPLTNADFPYTLQTSDQTNYSTTNALSQSNNAETIDKNAAAWCLNTILLPSGGQIEVNYESDSYTYVQDRKAKVMMQIAGFGHNATLDYNDHLYEVSGIGITENDYVFVNVPVACFSKEEVNARYLHLIPNQDNQLAFKLMVEMPKGKEYLPVYGVIEDYGIAASDPTNKTIWVKLREVDGIGALSLSVTDYLRTSLPGQAYPGYDVSEQSSIEQIGSMLIGMLDGIAASFSNPINYIRIMRKEPGQHVDRMSSFVRLGSGTVSKYGGGNRVKSVVLKDNWNKMTDQYTASYTQEYDYTTTENIGGVETTISSGVASYEPSIGGDENPFQSMLQVANSIPLGPTSYSAIEMPVLDGLFPAPLVGYSKVTIRSGARFTNPAMATLKSHSGIGRQVTEFYTAKDYPIKWSYTNFDGNSNQEVHHNVNALLWKSAFDSRAQSQGFLVELNDMHGKMKSQASFPENDDKTAINYTENFYSNTGGKGLNEKFSFASAANSGAIQQGNLGIDIELMTDTREFQTVSFSTDVQAQVDMFILPIIPPTFWMAFIWPVYGESESTYRSVTTTKTVNYHSILDSVKVVDKGSTVSTKNMVYDAETGQVLVTRTQNEFNDYIYNTTYPAYWAYSGMGLAYKNTDAIYKNISFSNGKISGSGSLNPYDVLRSLESGDELYLIDPGHIPTSACDAGMQTPDAQTLWVFDPNKNVSSLTNCALSAVEGQVLYFITPSGQPYTKGNVTFRVVRSGKRNLLGANVQTVTSMVSPIVNNKLVLNADSKVIGASATEYREKYQTDDDVFRRYITVSDDCTTIETENCEGHYEKAINPYLRNLLGTFRTNKSYVLYGNRTETDATGKANIPNNGFIDSYANYWNFIDGSCNNILRPPTDITASNWVWNSEVTRVNSRGQELETKNALGIYTAAQYGYHKNLPLAIANNSAVHEMFYEGFEDADFNETLNKAKQNDCSKKHISFSNIAHTSILNTPAEGVNAHTGNKVLKLAANNSGILNVPLSNDINANFSLTFGNENLTVYAEPGTNVTTKNVYGKANYQAFTNGGTVPANTYNNPITDGLSLVETPQNERIYHDLTTDCCCDECYAKVDVISDGYFEVKECKNYTFKGLIQMAPINATVPKTPDGGTTWFTNNAKYKIIIEEIVGSSSTVVLNKTIGMNDIKDDFAGTPSPGYSNAAPFFCGRYTDNMNETIPLGKGKYKFRTYIQFVHTSPAHTNVCGDNGSYKPEPSLGMPGYTGYININFQNNLAGFTPYKNLTTTTSCTRELAMEGSSSMTNPVFTPQKNKKMIFSGWVREAAIQSTYSGTNSVTIQYLNASGAQVGTNVNIIPTGNVIEGWQRVEGEFEIPSDAATMNLKLKNTNTDNSKASYWDDIRIQPYNANMKSFAYNPINLRLVAELDENNYAKFYEYDEEGTLIRTKAETKQGIKTITETRSAKQKGITDLP